MSNMDDDPRHNLLLAALPADEYARIEPHLERIQLTPGDILYEFGNPLQHVYFPTTAIMSLLHVMEDGASTEITGIGNEGMLGIALVMGGETMPNRAMVLCAGTAYRLKSRLLMNEFNRAGGRRTGALQHVLLRYTLALITQMSQNSVCNRHHSMEQRLCRWLLSILDRSSSNELTLTQELISNALGVRREGITDAAGKLQQAGLIHYRRGHITVLDRAGLVNRTCECYQTVKDKYDRLFPEAAAADIDEKSRKRRSNVSLIGPRYPSASKIASRHSTQSDR